MADLVKVFIDNQIVEMTREEAGIPSPLTEAEKQVELDACHDRLLAEFEYPDSKDKALAQAIFELLNEVRALQAASAVTPEQFKTWLRSKLS